MLLAYLINQVQYALASRNGSHIIDGTHVHPRLEARATLTLLDRPQIRRVLRQLYISLERELPCLWLEVLMGVCELL